jgi:ribosomal protein S18 acetylase RimI-like enzyme
MTIDFRPLATNEICEAVRLWDACGLTRPWNDPVADAERALAGPTSTIMGSYAAGHLIGTAMCGWDGHRGWIYYLGVDDDFRRWGIGRELIQLCEDWLGQFGAPKIQLMVRPENSAAAEFYEAIGYEEDSFRVFYRRIRTKCRQEQQFEAP